jgi:hypothetical protein
VKNKNLILNSLGIFILMIGILAIIDSVLNHNYSQILWFCYIGLLLIGIGILLRNSWIITSQLNILILPLIFWNIDFFYRLIARVPLWGITNYFFLPETNIFSKIITLQHLFTIPLSLYCLYIIKIKRKDSWKLSLLEVGLIFLAVRLFTSRVLNINCVFKSCINQLTANIQIPLTILWFLIFFIIIIVTEFVLNNIRAFKK